MFPKNPHHRKLNVNDRAQGPSPEMRMLRHATAPAESSKAPAHHWCSHTSTSVTQEQGPQPRLSRGIPSCSLGGFQFLSHFNISLLTKPEFSIRNAYGAQLETFPFFSKQNIIKQILLSNKILQTYVILQHINESDPFRKRPHGTDSLFP